MEVQRSIRQIAPNKPFAWGYRALENVLERALAERVKFEPLLRFYQKPAIGEDRTPNL